MLRYTDLCENPHSRFERAAFRIFIFFDNIHEMVRDTLYLFGLANGSKLLLTSMEFNVGEVSRKFGPSHGTASCSKFCNFLVQNFSSFQVSSL